EQLERAPRVGRTARVAALDGELAEEEILAVEGEAGVRRGRREQLHNAAVVDRGDRELERIRRADAHDDDVRGKRNRLAPRLDGHGTEPLCDRAPSGERLGYDDLDGAERTRRLRGEQSDL